MSKNESCFTCNHWFRLYKEVNKTTKELTPTLYGICENKASDKYHRVLRDYTKCDKHKENIQEVEK